MTGSTISITSYGVIQNVVMRLLKLAQTYWQHDGDLVAFK
jgi:hypothetical protein